MSRPITPRRFLTRHLGIQWRAPLTLGAAEEVTRLSDRHREAERPIAAA